MVAAEVAGGYEFPYLWVFVAFSCVMQILELWLEQRQMRKNLDKELPVEIKDIMNQEEYTAAQSYQYDKRGFSMLKEAVTCLHGNVMLIWVNPLMWHWVVGKVGADAEYQATLLWLFILQWADKPLAIPFQLYSHFVVEERHGFNKMTMDLFTKDFLKGEGIAYVMGGLIIPCMIWVIHYGGESAYLYLWALVQCLIFGFMYVYPNIIQPMFNKFEELKDEELKTKIGELCAGVDFPLTKLFQVDGSKRSSHSNAYFFGFWKNKRIVLFDTLLHLPHDDILAILCHELGHWQFGHIMYNLCISSVHIFFIFWFFGLVMYSPQAAVINNSFGYGRDNKAVMIGLMNFTSLLMPLEQVLRLGMTMLSRKFEFQADTYAHEKGRANELKAGLLQIHKDNKGELNPDAWYSWYHFSHPPLLERLRAMDLLKNKKA